MITKRWQGGTVRTVKTYCVCVHLCVLSRVQLFATPWTVAHQAPPNYGIFQARILAWVAISFFRGSSWLRNRTNVSCISSIGSHVLYQLSHQGSHLYIWLCERIEKYIYIYIHIHTCIYTLGILLQFSLIFCDDECLQPSNLHALLKGLIPTVHPHSTSP